MGGEGGVGWTGKNKGRDSSSPPRLETAYLQQPDIFDFFFVLFFLEAVFFFAVFFAAITSSF